VVILFPEIDSTEALAREAVEWVRDNLSDKGEIFVGFSGGKDSIVTAEIMRRSGIPFRLFYSATGIDPPPVVRFIRREYPDCVFLRPTRSFWKNLAVNVPPSDRLRWCCTAIKKAPAWKMPHAHRVMGIRAEESPRRKAYGRVNHFVNAETDHWQYYPIFRWKEWNLWEFISEANLSYPSVYDDGFDRVGCVICPYHSEPSGRLHAMYRDRWPGFFRLWEKEISKLWRKRQSAGKKMYHKTPGEFLAAWYRNQSARWYAEAPTPKKKIGQTTFDEIQ